ncbi:RNA polymerase-binding transcription factor DksA [Neolewinella maritima]|uniref:RNA polymerase-binding transcription factor DksA n=2 Tax=Neolewinella maritima TaxID=1383882 RepID=A0ABM9B5L0_9BACT|nr:RNA polymerase-binding transcription factor DksA [Neolewinella maritima]
MGIAVIFVYLLRIVLIIKHHTMQTQQQTRYSDAELAEFKTIIDAKLDEARRQLQFYREQMSEQTNSEDGRPRGLDDGSTTATNEDINRLAVRQQQLIQHLENALLRIHNKVYGICRQTGTLISAERLRIVPHTTLSIQAKQNR